MSGTGIKTGNTRSEQMTSALPPKADSELTSPHVRKVPTPEANRRPRANRNQIGDLPTAVGYARRKLAEREKRGVRGGIASAALPLWRASVTEKQPLMQNRQAPFQAK